MAPNGSKTFVFVVQGVIIGWFWVKHVLITIRIALVGSLQRDFIVAPDI